MNYRVLQNPITDEYLEFKRFVLSDSFPWYYKPSTTYVQEGYSANYIYSHKILVGPSAMDGSYIPTSNSDSNLLAIGQKVVEQILKSNNIAFKHIYRMVCNTVYYSDGIPSVPHIDHPDFFHKNLIVYLTQFECGNIDVYDDDGTMCTYKPNEDDVVTFDFKKHSINQPSGRDRRVAFVSTYS